MDRLEDVQLGEELADAMLAMAATDMQVDFVRDVLSSPPAALPWQIGEALAESLLAADHSAVWPWNSTRDRKTPKASLPGADIVGLSIETETAVFLFGEVKSSEDGNAPPGVMHGRSGMIHQLEALATNLDIQFALLTWLFARCKDTEFEAWYLEALNEYVSSAGQRIRLVGCLMRGATPVNSADLEARGLALSATLASVTSVNLYAWYLDGSCGQWPTWLENEDHA
ncbi:hypothetical protein [Pseudolysinimonas sp.]|uniref:hypothetical protein n=1 Tax=Pseudolysinimonas sp. TaxID=2680009 RepID=UPI00378419D7